MQRGALRSAFADRQWSQSGLRQAGFVDSSNCRLCVELGLCDPSDPSPRFKGTLVHRILTCPATEEYRKRHAPRWILDRAAANLRPDGTLPHKEHDFLVRAIVATPAPRVERPPIGNTFEWVVPLPSECGPCSIYVDGSRLYAEHDLFNMCARHGWAFSIYNSHLELVAAAHGLPPWWADGIHAAELWGLLQATMVSQPTDMLKVDCLAVQLGSQKGLEWANSPARKFARAWGPLASALEGDSERVVWMPAHCSAASTQQAIEDRSRRRLSDGTILTRHLVLANAVVDKHAKVAAGWRILNHFNLFSPTNK